MCQVFQSNGANWAKRRHQRGYNAAWRMLVSYLKYRPLAHATRSRAISSHPSADASVRLREPPSAAAEARPDRRPPWTNRFR